MDRAELEKLREEAKKKRVTLEIKAKELMEKYGFEISDTRVGYLASNLEKQDIHHIETAFEVQKALGVLPKDDESLKALEGKMLTLKLNEKLREVLARADNLRDLSHMIGREKVNEYVPLAIKLVQEFELEPNHFTNFGSIIAILGMRSGDIEATKALLKEKIKENMSVENPLHREFRKRELKKI
jgi:hypothetical protein